MANLLAGPSVRRVDSKGAYLWLVLDEQADISASAWRDDKKSEVLCELDADGVQSVRLGEHLCAYLLKLTSSTGALPQDVSCFYDVEIDGRNLSQLGLIDGDRPINYPGYSLPSFYLPNVHQNILQGSCRKPHAGKGRRSRPDLMIEADRLVGSTMGSLKDRPSQLYLTGDQIYADDVETALLASLIELADAYRGKESLPDPRNIDRPLTPAELPLASRHKVMSKKIGFTSGEAKNHLMTFGEYMSMYLVSWGGVSVSLPPYKKVQRRLAHSALAMSSIDYLTSGGRRRAWQGRHEYSVGRRRTINHLSTCWRSRRLMANVATYMIFDDHDVTDDWNLTPEITNLLKSNACSKRVIGNALAAYWVCQDWGNDPERADHAQIRALLERAYGDGDEQALVEAEQVLTDRRWGFEIKQQPYVVAIDTRTHRIFNSRGRPGLLDAVSMDTFRENLTSDDVTNTVIVISPAPVYGFKGIELLQVNTPRCMASTVDMESWIGNPEQFEAFKRIIHETPAKHVVALSGDVHYGFARREVSDDTTVWQLTSSALSNRPVGGSFLVSVLEHAAIFLRENTPYLIPNNQKREIINHHSTVGLLTLEGDRPSVFTAYCKNDKGQSYKWLYDLKRPRLFN